MMLDLMSCFLSHPPYTCFLSIKKSLSLISFPFPAVKSFNYSIVLLRHFLWSNHTPCLLFSRGRGCNEIKKREDSLKKESNDSDNFLKLLLLKERLYFPHPLSSLLVSENGSHILIHSWFTLTDHPRNILISQEKSPSLQI